MLSLIGVAICFWGWGLGWFELALTKILKFYFHLSFLGELNPNGALCTPKHGKIDRKSYYSKQHIVVLRCEKKK